MMNMKKLEKWILLEHSGELSRRRCRKLARCAGAQGKRAELKALCNAVPSLAAEPSPWAVTKIEARLRAERVSVRAASRAWKPALALAACLTLVVGTWSFRQTPSASAVFMTAEVDVWNDQFEEDLAELETLILAMSGDSMDIMEM